MAQDARSRAGAAEAEAKAVAARDVALAEARAVAAERAALAAQARADAADAKVDEMKRLARSPPGGSDATLDQWKAEAAAAVASSPGKDKTGASDPSGLVSPVKRRRDTSPEPEFADAQEEVENENGEAADARAEAEAMTVAKLKHELQMKGMAHLYVGKKGLKKADYVEMYMSC